MAKDVLLVDDDEPFVYLMRRVINTEAPNPIKVLHCENGKLALEHLKECLEKESDQAKIPDIIFLDINMPVMSGFEFLNEITNLFSQSKRSIPPPTIYLLSSSSLESDQVRAKEFGIVKQYLVKPLARTQVGKILREVG